MCIKDNFYGKLFELASELRTDYYYNYTTNPTQSGYFFSRERICQVDFLEHVILEFSDVQLPEEGMVSYQTLNDCLKSFSEIDYLVYEAIFGEDFSVLTLRCPSPRMAGLACNLQVIAENIAFCLPGALESFFLECEKTVDFLKTEGVRISRECYPRWGKVELGPRRDMDEVELIFDLHVTNFENMIDNIWVYSAINGLDDQSVAEAPTKTLSEVEQHDSFKVFG